MIAILLAIITATSSQPRPIVVDRCELNHYCRGEGEQGFSQVILWRSMRMERWGSHVANWRLLKDDRFSRTRGNPEVIRFYDGHDLVVVHARYFHETFTRHDPEYADRQELPEPDRRPYMVGGEE